MTPGILVVWNDCTDEGRAAYERWYVEEHLYERVGLPGFRFGRRFEAVEGGPRYFTYYEVDAPAILQSAVYLERIQNPTARTTAVMPGFREMNRSVCSKVAHVGLRLLGGWALTLRIPGDADAAPHLPRLRETAQALLTEAEVLGAQVWEAEPGSRPDPQRPLTREEQLRGKRDESIAAALVVDLMRPEAGLRLLQSKAFQSLARDSGGTAGLYRLLCDLRHAEALAQSQSEATA